MPTAPTRPTNIDLPFAYAGTKNTIPDAATGTNHASFHDGFPPVTMLPIASGGIPPEGNDFNGLFFDITTHTLWVNAGGQYLFDAGLSTAMGGYPKGMVLQNTALNASYVSLVDNNTTDFNSTPSSIGTLWGSYSGAAFSNAAVATTGGTVTLSAIQAMADMITVTGTLTSNAVLVFPVTIGETLVVNNTTGAFMLSATITGAGVQIKQGAADAIYNDGTNIGYQQNSASNRSAGDVSRSTANTLYADRSSSRVGGYSADIGAVNAYVIATVPPTTAYADGQTVRFRPAAANTLSACTLNAGGGTKALVRADGSLPRPGDVTGVVNATYELALDKWTINGLIVPDIALARLSYLNATQTLSGGDWLVDTSAGPFACNLNSIPLQGDAVTLRDAIGTWRDKPFTLVATGGASIIYVDNAGVTHSDTTLICNTRGWEFTVWFDGTNWRLI